MGHLEVMAIGNVGRAFQVRALQAEAALGNGRLQRFAEGRFHVGQRDAVLGAHGAGQTGLHGGQVQF